MIRIIIIRKVPHAEMRLRNNLAITSLNFKDRAEDLETRCKNIYFKSL